MCERLSEGWIDGGYTLSHTLVSGEGSTWEENETHKRLICLADESEAQDSCVTSHGFEENHIVDLALHLQLHPGLKPDTVGAASVAHELGQADGDHVVDTVKVEHPILARGSGGHLSGIDDPDVVQWAALFVFASEQKQRRGHAGNRIDGDSGAHQALAWSCSGVVLLCVHDCSRVVAYILHAVWHA